MNREIPQGAIIVGGVDSAHNVNMTSGVNGSNRASNNRDRNEVEMTNITNGEGDNALIDTAITRQPEPPIEELVNKIIIHNDRPIENLPEISPPELKIIGRCVTFVADTVIGGESKRFHYEGLVGTINKDTVMLINVYRFTDEDFQIHRLEQKREVDSEHDGSADTKLTKPHTASKPIVDTTEKFGQPLPILPHSEQFNGLTISREEQEDAYDHSNNINHNNNINSNNSNAYNSNMNSNDSSNNAGSNGVSGNEIHDLENSKIVAEQAESSIQLSQLANSRNKLQFITGSYGPIPYMTFVRSHIHNVEFARDPASSFYSLFRDPSREIFDMQCLRMFVRRYLVHTSQGNNPRQVPLRAFVTCRCNCPNLDNELLLRITHEELAHLIKVDRDIKRAQRRKERLLRRNVMALRAPPGIFSGTGILFFTGLPRQTLSVAVLEFIMMLILIVHFGVTITIAEPYLIYTYMRARVGYLAVCAVVTILASILSATHAIRMRLPLKRHLLLVFIRVFVVTAALVCTLIMMGVMVKSATLRQMSEFVYHNAPQHSLCEFYELYQCTGFLKPCPSTHNDSINLANVDSLYTDTHVFTSVSSGNERNRTITITANNDDANTKVENHGISSFPLQESKHSSFWPSWVSHNRALSYLLPQWFSEHEHYESDEHLFSDEEDEKICNCPANQLPRFTVSCKAAVRGEVQRSTVPAVCFAVSLACILIIDNYLHYKLFCIAHFFSQLAESHRRHQ